MVRLAVGSARTRLRVWRDQRSLRKAWRHIAVVFTLPEREIARLDIALGPCVPPPGRKRPLAGPFRQRTGTAEEMEALFRVMVPGSTAPAWATTRREGRGQLCVFADEFVQPLGARNGDPQRSDRGRHGLRRGERFARGHARSEQQWSAGPAASPRPGTISARSSVGFSPIVQRALRHVTACVGAGGPARVGARRHHSFPLAVSPPRPMS